MRARTATPRRTFAAIVVTAGLAVGASACASDDDTDPSDDVDVETPTETDMTGTMPTELGTTPMDGSVGG